jgi:hypothetical protein
MFVSSDRTSEKKNENEHQNAQKAQNPQYAVGNLLMHTLLGSRRIQRKKAKRTSERSVSQVGLSSYCPRISYNIPLSVKRRGGHRG